MEENDGTSSWGSGAVVVGIVIGIVIGNIFFPSKYEEMTAEEWYAEYGEQVAENEELNEELARYKIALDEANSNIEDAKFYLGASYEEMADALLFLDTVDTPY